MHGDHEVRCGGWVCEKSLEDEAEKCTFCASWTTFWVPFVDDSVGGDAVGGGKGVDESARRG